jgi:hypothetical protein
LKVNSLVLKLGVASLQARHAAGNFTAVFSLRGREMRPVKRADLISENLHSENLYNQHEHSRDHPALDVEGENGRTRTSRLRSNTVTAIPGSKSSKSGLIT